MGSVKKLRAGALSFKRSALLTLICTKILTALSFAALYFSALYAWSCLGVSVVGCVLGAFGVVMFGVSSVVASFLTAAQYRDIIEDFKTGFTLYEAA